MHVFTCRFRVLETSAMLGAILAGFIAHADTARVGPFVGELDETWESYSSYVRGEPITYLPSPNPIMGGAASISSPLMLIFDDGVNTFNLGANGNARTADGDRAMAVDDFDQLVIVTFPTPIVAFGAYLGSYLTPSFPPDSGSLSDGITVSLSNGFSEMFSYVRPNDGVLEWHGWQSTTGFSSVTLTGDFLVMDGLQASGHAVSAVPESGSTGLLVSLAAIAGLVARFTASRWQRRGIQGDKS